MKIETFNIGDLNPAIYNPRTITKEALTGLENSIKTFGYIEPIVINIRDKKNVIISGHQRFKALQNMGINTAECVVLDVDETTEKAINIAANNQHISGQWDTEKLDELLKELSANFEEFESINFEKLSVDLDFESPDFEPGEESDQGNLGEIDPIECPNCGHKWKK